MKTVQLHIRGREYAVGCEEGQEAHLLHLAHALNERMERQFPPQETERAPDTLLFLLSALTLLDEINEYQMINREDAPAALPPKQERALCEMIHSLASSIEVVAATLESRYDAG